MFQQAYIGTGVHGKILDSENLGKFDERYVRFAKVSICTICQSFPPMLVYTVKLLKICHQIH